MPLSELDDAIRITTNIQTANKDLQKIFFDKKQNSSKEALKKNWENR
jgi:hypothetical protein